MAEDLHHSPHHTTPHTRFGVAGRIHCFTWEARDRIPHTQDSWPADRIMLGTKSMTLMVGFVGRRGLHVVDLPLQESGPLVYVRLFGAFLVRPTRNRCMTWGHQPPSVLLADYLHTFYHHHHRLTNNTEELFRNSKIGFPFLNPAPTSRLAQSFVRDSAAKPELSRGKTSIACKYLHSRRLTDSSSQDRPLVLHADPVCRS
jgi:hypothetical protein